MYGREAVHTFFTLMGNVWASKHHAVGAGLCSARRWLPGKWRYCLGCGGVKTPPYRAMNAGHPPSLPLGGKKVAPQGRMRGNLPPTAVYDSSVRGCAQPPKQKTGQSQTALTGLGAPAGTRILGPLIKSQMLYQLSYRHIYALCYLQLYYYTSQCKNCQYTFLKNLRRNSPRRALPSCQIQHSAV